MTNGTHRGTLRQPASLRERRYRCGSPSEAPRESLRKSPSHTPAFPDHACTVKRRHKIRRDIPCLPLVRSYRLFAPGGSGSVTWTETPSIILHRNSAVKDAWLLFARWAPKTYPSLLHVAVLYGPHSTLLPVRLQRPRAATALLENRQSSRRSSRTARTPRIDQTLGSPRAPAGQCLVPSHRGL